MGPRIEKIPGLDMHCETILENSKCPYLSRGCRGCIIKGSPLSNLVRETVAIMKKIKKQYNNGIHADTSQKAVRRG